MNNAVIDLFYQINDSENERSIDELAQGIYDAMDDARQSIEEALLRFPEWVEYCIDAAVNAQNVYNLEQEWYAAWQELIEIKRELVGYDYSFFMSQEHYYIGSGNDIEVTMNGDYGAVENLLYFDIYKPVFSEEQGDYVLEGYVMERDSDYTLEPAEDGTIVFTIMGGFLDTMEEGAQLFSPFYETDEGLKYADIYVEVMVRAAIQPKADTPSDIAPDAQVAVDALSGSASGLDADESKERDSDAVLRPASEVSEVNGMHSNWMLLAAAAVILVLIIITITCIVKQAKKKKVNK